MSVDETTADEARALARAFARRLEYLREFRALNYVGAAPVPMADEELADETVGDERIEVVSESRQATSEPEPSRPPPAPIEAPRASMVPLDRHRPPPPSPPSRERPAAQQGAPARARPQSPAPSRAGASSAEQWPAAKKLAFLRDHIGDCQRCPLAPTRRNIVFGVGNPEAKLMFVGEAPGADEDRLGEPFVGAAGRRLDQWIEHIGMRRDDVYIANVLKCRPPGNRDPQAHEIERCAPFLHAQIRAIAPKVLVALGRFSGCLLLGRELKLWEMRGSVHTYREPKTGVEIPLLVTYHPAYVLRSEQPRRGVSPGQPDRAGAIKSEDEKVLADLARAASLL